MVSIPSLSTQAKKMLYQSPDSDIHTLVIRILPNHEQWAQALAPFLTRPPNPALALTTSFGGAVDLITAGHRSDAAIRYDGYGQSLAYRFFNYLIDLISDSNVLRFASDEQRTDLAFNFALFLQLAGDNVSVDGSMPLWNPLKAYSEEDVFDLIAKAQSALASWLYEAPESGITIRVQMRLLEGSLGTLSSSYYYGRAYSSIAGELVEKHGQPLDFQRLGIGSITKSVDTFHAFALLSSMPEGRDLTRICNELLASLTGGNLEKDFTGTLRSAVLLNYVLQHAEGIVEEIPQQRLVFFTKHVVNQLQKTSTTVRTEILKSLYFVLSPIKEIYGPFWDTILGILHETFDEPATDATLPALTAALRLLSLLRKQDMQDGNDDLLDAWTEYRALLAKRMVELAGKVKGL